MYIIGEKGKHWKDGIHKINITPFIIKDLEEIRERMVKDKNFLLTTVTSKPIKLRKIGYSNCKICKEETRILRHIETEFPMPTSSYTISNTIEIEVFINDKDHSFSIEYDKILKVKDTARIIGESVDHVFSHIIDNIKVPGNYLYLTIKDNAYKKLKFDEKDREKFYYLNYNAYCVDRAHLIYNYVKQLKYDVSIKGIYKKDIKQEYDKIIKDIEDKKECDEIMTKWTLFW